MEVGTCQPRPGSHTWLYGPRGVGNAHCLLKQSYRPLCLARRQAGTTQMVERDCLAVAVADLTGDRQRLGEQVDRLPVISQAGMTQSEGASISWGESQAMARSVSRRSPPRACPWLPSPARLVSNG